MKVLVPIDGSEGATMTILWASENLDKSATRYFLLFVIPQSISEILQEDEQEELAVRKLKESRWFLEQKGCLVERAEYVLGDPVDSICRYANEVDVDEVLIGSHGTSIPKTLSFGSSEDAMKTSEEPDSCPPSLNSPEDYARTLNLPRPFGNVSQGVFEHCPKPVFVFRNFNLTPLTQAVS